MEQITELFATATHNGSAHAQNYLQGLLSEMPAKNMYRMGERVPGAKEGNLQQFLSDSPWSHKSVWQWTSQRANQHLGGHKHSMLLVDESAMSKKGDQSVGVARQHNGRLGKIDNCVVGVFAALALKTRATLTGARLYLPAEWAEKPERCRKAGIPEAEIRFRTKIELARELVTEALANQLDFSWVGVDAGYGRDQGFLCWVADQNLGVVADVPEDLRVWTQKPEVQQRPKVMKTSGAQPVGQLAQQWIATRKRRKVKLRESENGPVRVEVWAQRVWIWAEDQAPPRCWWLIVRRDRDGQVKLTVCNAPESASLQELAELQGGRHFIERTFEDSKSHVGMAQYQVRKWLGWQHHMALVGLGMLFVLQERILVQTNHPLLSVADVVELMNFYFMAHPDLETLLEKMAARHKRRTQLQRAATKRAQRQKSTQKNLTK